MDQKRLFIADYLTRSFSIVDLCARYGISRPTGYKWSGRFVEQGYPGLKELSRRPENCPLRSGGFCGSWAQASGICVTARSRG